MKLSSCKVWSRLCFLVFLIIAVLLLAGLLFPLWIKRVKNFENEVKLIAYDFDQELISGIRKTSTLLSPFNASATNLVRLLSSSHERNELNFSRIQTKVAPTLFQALSTIPYLSEISYIGLDGLFFTYYTNGDQVYSLYSNSTFYSIRNTRKKYTWYKQLANSDTGKLYGKVIKFPPYNLVDSIWFRGALNSTNGYASLGTGCDNSSDILLLSTAGMAGRGAISLGFSIKSIIESFTNEIEFYNGSLYMATKDGNVLTQGIPNTRMILVGNQILVQLLGSFNDIPVENITCQPGEEGSKLSISDKKYMITCSVVEIAGLELVYVLALPLNELPSLVEKNVRLAFLLLIIMIGIMVIKICTFVYVILGAARREMYLCDALIKQMESTQQAERKSMNKSLAFASASHDIRASLAGITGLIEICLNEVSKRDLLRLELRSNLLQMDACAKDLLGILNSILDTTKIEAGKMQLLEDEFDLQQLLEDVVDLYHPVGMKKGIDIILDPCDGSIAKSSHVKGDRGKLKQILCNLLSNAVKFTTEGHVTVRAWSRKPTLENEIIVSNGNKSMSWLFCLLSNINDESENTTTIQRDPNCMEFVFEVNDTGRGIPIEKQKSVFENYVQINEATNEICQEGTGLGLGIVQSLVRLMGGEIIIMDKEVGERGTCFRFNVFFNISEANISTNPDHISSHHEPINHSSPKGQRSHIILFIHSPKRSSILQDFIKTQGIKVHIVTRQVQLSLVLKKIKRKLNLTNQGSPGNSDIVSSSSSTRSKEVPLSVLDGMDNSVFFSQRKLNGPGGFVLMVIDTRAGSFEEVNRAVAQFKRELNNYCWSRVVWLDYLGLCSQGLIDPLDFIVCKPFHGSRVYQAIGLLPEFRNITPSLTRVEDNNSARRMLSSHVVEAASTSNNSIEGKKLLTGKKILVADDDLVGRKIAVFVAKQLGASALTCENGEEAWKLVCTSLNGANAVPFDCILMDCQMPRMDGIEATRRIREVERNYGGVRIPIIALTAHERGEEMDKMVRAGVDACLTKPLNKESFSKVLSELKA